MGNLCMNPAEEDPPPQALPPPLPSPPPQLMPVPESDLQPQQQQHESGDTTVEAVQQEEASNPNQGSTGNDDFPYEFLYLSEDSPTNQAPSVGGAEQATGSDGLIAAAIFRADVLATFECPFQRPCTTEHCPFGHQGATLRSIPSYFCLDYLLMGQCGAQGTEDDLPRCEMGFHPTVQDLINLNVFIQKLSSAVLLSDMLKPGPKKQPQPMEFEESDNLEPSTISSTKDPCEICLDTIPPSGVKLAYMDNCFHCFHADCLLGWRDQKRNAGAPNDLVDCPVCRLDSARILLWPCEFASEEDKKTTFQLQKECFGLMIEPETSSAMRQVPNREF